MILRFLLTAAASGWFWMAGSNSAGAEDAPRREWDGKPGFCRFAGTISPDRAWVFIWAPAGLAPEDLAHLPEWAADLDINSDKTDVENFLYDLAHQRVALKLPGLDYFAGLGWHKNRGELYVAWTADSRSALVICEERWDDEGILWVDTAQGRVFDLKDSLEKAYQEVLRRREKEDGEVNMQFCDPALLPGSLLVLDGNAGHMKEGPYYHYRFVFRVALPASGPDPALELVKAWKIPESEEHNTGVDYDPDLNLYYKQLRSRLDDQAKAALKEEQLGWLKFRDAQPQEVRDEITARRAVELRAMVETMDLGARKAKGALKK